MVLLAALLAAWLAPAPAPHKQLLVVTTPSWTATSGRAVLFEGGRVVLGPFTVAVGAGGLGWGSGLSHASASDPVKREGDGRSPAGVFTLGPIWRWPFSIDTVCIDDPDATDYGRIFVPTSAPAWRSAERMSWYRVAVLVGHNTARKPGAGSCIFLHDGHTPTVGCTAFEPSDLNAIVARLRPGAKIVQLPEAEYRDARARWSLPPLAD